MQLFSLEIFSEFEKVLACISNKKEIQVDYYSKTRVKEQLK